MVVNKCSNIMSKRGRTKRGIEGSSIESLLDIEHNKEP